MRDAPTNQGSASAMKILNVFDPNAFDTDIVPRPCLATIIEENMLGREVPPAVRVRPMMSSGMPRMQPIVSALRESTKQPKVSGALSLFRVQSCESGWCGCYVECR